MRILGIIAAILLVIGGLNWGLVGLFDFNIVQYLFSSAAVVKGIYIAIGLSAIYYLCQCKQCCRK